MSEGPEMSEKNILVHGALTYECEKCGKKWRMFLECGVESCSTDKNGPVCSKCNYENGEGIMPCPFIIGCACGGLAKHIDWHKDTRFPHPMPVFKHMSYFMLDREGLKNKNPRACGIPVVRGCRIKTELLLEGPQ